MNKFKFFCLIVAMVILGAGNTLATSTQPSYPIDSTVLTTLERTVIPGDIPSTSPKLLPNELSKYSQYGYGTWQFGKGLAFQKRLDLMPASYINTSVVNKAKLLRFFL